MLTVKACAKINLALDVLFKRPDGYHEVNMVMQSIGLADTVTLAAGREDIAVTCNVPNLACDSTNLAYRAAALLRDTLQVKAGAAIHLRKEIPLAAGLAGGSSNAAAVLAGLNRLWQLGLSQAELMTIGAALGSDVPFCLAGGTMRAYGRGELLERLPPLPPCYVVLAKPTVGVSTAWVYSQYRAENVTCHPDITGMTAFLAAGDYGGVAARLGNVLESVTLPAYPEVARIKESMLAGGAAALMSGSGPTVFGLLTDGQEAVRLASRLKDETGAEVFTVQTVAEVEW